MPKLKQEVDNLNIPVIKRNIENIIKTLPTKKSPSPKTGIRAAEFY